MAQRVIGELVVRLKGDRSQLDTTLDQTQSRFQQVANNLGSIGNKMSLAVTAPLTLLGGVILKSIGDMEMLETSFETMLGSADKARKHMEDLKRMAASTPFETGQLANASKMLLQYGVSIDDIIPNMRMLGDIASGDAQKFSSLALVFSQVKGLGRLTGQDLRQMINAGFNPLYVISEKTGESMASLTDKMSKGQISFEDLVDSMKAATGEGGKFYQGMEKGSKTLQGLLSTLKDDAMEAGRNLLQEFLPAIKDIVKFVSSLAQGFGNLTPGMKHFILNMAGILAAIGPVAKGLQLFTKGLDLIHKHPAILVIGALVTVFLALASAIEDAQTVNKRMADSLENERQETQKLIDRFNVLNEKTDLNKEEKNELIKTEIELKKRIGETAIEIDKQTGKFKLNTEAAAGKQKKNVTDQIKYLQRQLELGKVNEAEALRQLKINKSLVDNDIKGRISREEALRRYISAEEKYRSIQKENESVNNRLIELGGILLDINDPSRVERRLKNQKEEVKTTDELAKKTGELKKEAQDLQIIYDKIGIALSGNKADSFQEKINKILLNRTKTFAEAIGSSIAIANDAIVKYSEDQAKKIEESQRAIVSTIIDSVSQISSIVSSAYQNRLIEIDNEYKTQKEAIEGSVASEAQKKAQLEKLDEEYREKTKKAKQEEFAANKTFAIIDIAIKTAMAIARAFSDYPFPYSAIVAGIVGALGIAQTAIVASQPMPQFGTGGLVMPQEGGVPVIVAERRTPEFIIPDNGNVWQQVGDRIVQSMSRPINNNINNQVNLPNTLMVNIGGKEFMGFLTDASRAGKFSISQKHGLSRRD